MAKVKILPEVLAHQIAAGEIVERPASVVKELVENAIDANSDNILVELADGGKSRIRIKDNGFGMSREERTTPSGVLFVVTQDVSESGCTNGRSRYSKVDSSATPLPLFE